MTHAPDVSVVMSAYNAAANLQRTLDSVLGQEGCELEFVVVNDGSTDATGEILERRARLDPRLRVFHQERNAGLTRALVRGCALARGDFIARQDADDLSLAGRLQRQVSFLREHPNTVLVAGGLRFVAPSGDWLFDVQPDREIDCELEVTRLRLPSLVATCFRRDAYLRAGGFRPEFVVAQDVDLWLRLLEQGRCLGMPDMVYEATMTSGGITSLRRPQQLRMAALAVECARLRREGRDDAPVLAPNAGATTASRPQRTSSGRDRAAFHYFIGACLRGHNPEAARRYFKLALRDNPLHLKALVHCFLT